MPSFNRQFFSIVLIGRQNPQILNHDFLVSHNILPQNKSPFKELLQEQDSQPFTEFFATPIVTSIKYNTISIITEENRFQIMENNFKNPVSSPIIQITRKYFGELLRYTPFQAGGINFNGSVTFHDIEDEYLFDSRLGLNRDTLCGLIGISDLRISTSFSFPIKSGIAEVQISKPKDRTQAAIINFNYEFKYVDIDSFLGNLDDVSILYERFNDLLQALGVRSEP